MDGHQRKITSYFSLPPVDQSAVNKSQLNKDQSGDSDESMNSDVEMNEDSSDLEDNEVYWKDDDAKMDNQKKTDDDEVVSWLQLRNDKKSQKLLALFRSWQGNEWPVCTQKCLNNINFFFVLFYYRYDKM